MPTIQPKVVIPVKPITQAKPFISASRPTPSSTPSKVTYTGAKSLRGGLTASHTGEVIDLSSDKSQGLPYVASCITCGWQSRKAEEESAISEIKGHVGI